MEEEDELRFGFDLLDPTKIVPEEYVPITPLGKLQLNRNPRYADLLINLCATYCEMTS